MLPDRVSNPGLLTYESGALPIALHGPARTSCSSGLCWIKKAKKRECTIGPYHKKRKYVIILFKPTPDAAVKIF